jgi:hypothetical protein
MAIFSSLYQAVDAIVERYRLSRSETPLATAAHALIDNSGNETGTMVRKFTVTAAQLKASLEDPTSTNLANIVVASLSRSHIITGYAMVDEFFMGAGVDSSFASVGLETVPGNSTNFVP